MNSSMNPPTNSNEEDSGRREAILQAALHVFARDGFHKASIKQIARAADLKSPSLIYWYFKDKNELLQAVITRLVPVFGAIAQPEAAYELPPEQVFTLVAEGYLRVFENPDVVRMMRLFLSEAMRSPDSITPLAETLMKQVLNFVVSYLQHQIDRGQLKPHDPHAVARAFVGTLFIYVLQREIIQSLPGLPEAAHYREEVVRLFLDGLRP